MKSFHTLLLIYFSLNLNTLTEMLQLLIFYYKLKSVGISGRRYSKKNIFREVIINNNVHHNI